MRTLQILLTALTLVLTAAALSGCASAGPSVKSDSKFLTDEQPPVGDSVTTFYALGDWGTGEDLQYKVAAALERQINALDSNKVVAPFVVGLGDNVYPDGLQTGWANPVTDTLLARTFGRPFAKVRWKGRAVDFHNVPGNHDYAYSMTTSQRTLGFGDVIHQETTAEGRFEGFHYYPLSYPGKPDGNDENEYNDIYDKSGLAGLVGLLPEKMNRPERVETPPEAPVTIVALDTPALIERREHRNDPANDPSWRVLDSLLAMSTDPWKFIIGHHPILTFSSHGEHRTLDNWLWTGSGGRVARSFNEERLALLASGVFAGALISPVGWVVAGVALAIPALSVVGDNVITHRQDLDHWAYRSFADSLQHLLGKHNAIYLAGHDHTLQLIEVDRRIVQIVSGSASKSSWVASSAPELHYSTSKHGFARFDLTDEELFLRFCTVDAGDGSSRCEPTFRFEKPLGAVSNIE